MLDVRNRTPDDMETDEMYEIIEYYYTTRLQNKIDALSGIDQSVSNLQLTVLGNRRRLSTDVDAILAEHVSYTPRDETDPNLKIITDLLAQITMTADEAETAVSLVAQIGELMGYKLKLHAYKDF